MTKPMQFSLWLRKFQKIYDCMDSVDGLEEFTQDEIMRALDYLLQEGFVKAVIRNGEPYLVIADEAKDL